MTDRSREELALRAIVVSGRSALRKTRDLAERERIQGRVHELLADLESAVIRDGGDPDLLALIERKRRQVWD